MAISTKENPDTYEAVGDLKTERNDSLHKDEVVEEYYQDNSDEISKKKLETTAKLTLILAWNSIFEEFIYEYSRECEIRRPIKGDVYILRDPQGRHLIERITAKDGQFSDRKIMGTVRCINGRKVPEGGLGKEGLVEEWIDKDSFIRRRDIIGELEVFTKPSGEMGLREKIGTPSDQPSDEADMKPDYRVIHGVIKTVGDGRRIMVDQYQELNNLVRREITGI